jgi:ferredoxin--NADP+ reductase
MGKWIEGTVVEQTAWTERLRSLRVQAEVGGFEAGQWMKLAVRVGSEMVARPYSFVNPPRETPHEFYYNLVPDGPLSARLAKLEPRDVVFLVPGTSGTFVLSQIPDGENLWMMATGTGLGPFLSMLRTDAPWQRFRSVVLVHAVRHANELAYRDVIEGVRERYPERFRAVYFVSRETHAGSLAGRIPQAIASHALERAAGVTITPRGSQVMLCGNPDMVIDATEVLKARGMRRHRRREPGHIAVEPYW